MRSNGKKPWTSASRTPLYSMFRAGTAKRQASQPQILVVRLGSLGDVVHALPAVATLKHGFPGSVLTWVVNPRWSPLLEGNPFVDRLIFFDRRNLRCAREAWSLLRAHRYDFAVDLQGLVQSALITSFARADRIYGFHESQAREKLAAVFYSNRVRATSSHVVDQNLELAAAAGASTTLPTFPLPDGAPDGALPEGPFVLANPSAGWGAKQWPFDHYRTLGERLRKEARPDSCRERPPRRRSGIVRDRGSRGEHLRHSWSHSCHPSCGCRFGHR